MDHSDNLSQHLTVFCTDLIDQSLAAARNAEYKLTGSEFTPSSMLEQFINKNGSKVEIAKEFKSYIAIVRRCLGKEPHIPKVDLIYCSNIYVFFKANSQDYIIDLFAYSLNLRCVLVPGGSESVGRDQECKVVARIHLIYENRHEQTYRSIGFLAQKVRDYSNVHWSAKSPLVICEFVSGKHIRLLERLVLSHGHCALFLGKNLNLAEVVRDESKYCQMTEERMTTSASTCLADLQDRARELIQQVHPECKSSNSRSMKIDNLDDSISINAVPLAVAKRNLTVNYSDHKEGICLVRDQYQIVSYQKNGSLCDIRRLESKLYANQVSQHVSIVKLDLRCEEFGAANDILLRAAEKTQTQNEELQASFKELLATIEVLTVLNQDDCVRSKE
jgi:hypothetical protein